MDTFSRFSAEPDTALDETEAIGTAQLGLMLAHGLPWDPWPVCFFFQDYRGIIIGSNHQQLLGEYSF